MRRHAALAFGLLAASCLQVEAGSSGSAQQAAWLATEERLDSEARELAPKLEVLARQTGSQQLVEALTVLESARRRLHKTRVTLIDELAAPARDPAAAEERLRAAELRMSAAVLRLETRLTYARSLISAAEQTTAPIEPEP